MKCPIKGAMGIFLNTQQHSRPGSLAAYVTFASQVIKHSVSHFKLKQIIVIDKTGLFIKDYVTLDTVANSRCQQKVDLKVNCKLNSC